jgi:hypothetical protein
MTQKLSETTKPFEVRDLPPQLRLIFYGGYVKCPYAPAMKAVDALLSPSAQDRPDLTEVKNGREN